MENKKGERGDGETVPGIGPPQKAGPTGDWGLRERNVEPVAVFVRAI
jgi:hypothetical protein